MTEAARPAVPGESLPQGLARLSDGSLEIDGLEALAVLRPPRATEAPVVPVAVGLRVLEALGGARRPGASVKDARGGPEETAEDVVEGAAGAATGGRGAASERAGAAEVDAAALDAAPALDSAADLQPTGVWEDPDDIPLSHADLEDPEGSAGLRDPVADDDSRELPSRSFPEPEPGSGRRRRGGRRHRAVVVAPGEDGPPSADTPTAPGNDGSASRVPAPVESLPTTEVVPASEAALIAAPSVRAAICPQGHANPPDLGHCLHCGQHLTGVFSYVRRPALATLTLSTGDAVGLAGDVVVGRAPQTQAGMDPRTVVLLAVPSRNHMISRSHLMLSTVGWNVFAQDLGSSNGTVLARPGVAPVLLGTAIPTPLLMGDLIDLGDGVTIRLDPPKWVSPLVGPGPVESGAIPEGAAGQTSAGSAATGAPDRPPLSGPSVGSTPQT